MANNLLQLAIATLTGLFGTVYATTGGKKTTTATPPINASSSDEEDFIKSVYERPYTQSI